MSRHPIACKLLLLCSLPARWLAAHEYWVEPKAFVVEPAREMPVALKVGDGADIEEKKFDSSHVREFFATDGKERVKIASTDGAQPAACVAFPRAGTWAVVYWSRNKSIELEPKKFEEYLREDGLEPILEERRRLGESEQPAREVYMRCAKALVKVGDPKATADAEKTVSSAATTAIGMPLEIIARSELAAAAAQNPFPFELLYAGKPLENALVKIVRLDEPTKELTVRTAKEGRFEFVPSAGDWRVSAVHMIRAENEPGAQWQSYWASLTFRIDFPTSTTTKAASDSGS